MWLLRPILAAILMSLLFVGHTAALVELPPFFSDHMVLQRDAAIPIWGWAVPGEKVTVNLAGQQISTETDKACRWRVTLKPISDPGPFELVVTGYNTVVIKDVLIGDVWLFAGGASMASRLSQLQESDKIIASAHSPRIRCFSVHGEPNRWPQENLRAGRWHPSTETTARHFPALPFFVARGINRGMKVPVGIIDCSRWYCSVEAWISEEALREDSTFAPLLARFGDALDVYPEAIKKYEIDLRAWEKVRDQAKAAKEKGEKEPRVPPRPASPIGYGHAQAPFGIYNAIIRPLVPYAVRGVIWYQGQTNTERAHLYRYLLSTLIQSWRQEWGQNLPFLLVQLSQHRGRQQRDANADSPWAELRESQWVIAREVANTALAVTIDESDVWTRSAETKQRIAERVVLLARSMVYGQDVLSSGPTFKRMERRGNALHLYFTHTGAGLAPIDEPVTGFAIAGKDRQFRWADARIEGDTVVVTSKKVDEPVAVRYGWGDHPDCNLRNREGLPAPPFRTDQWLGATHGIK